MEYSTYAYVHQHSPCSRLMFSRDLGKVLLVCPCGPGGTWSYIGKTLLRLELTTDDEVVAKQPAHYGPSYVLTNEARQPDRLSEAFMQAIREEIDRYERTRRAL